MRKERVQRCVAYLNDTVSLDNNLFVAFCLRGSRHFIRKDKIKFLFINPLSYNSFKYENIGRYDLTIISICKLQKN